MLTFERININSVDWEYLDSLQDRKIFQTLPWLKFVAKTQNAEPVIASIRDNNQILGYFTGLIIKKFGFKILGSPFQGWTTAYMGFNLLPGTSRHMVIEPLIHFVFKELKCVHFEIMDRNMTLEDCGGLGFEHRLFSGFEIDLTQKEDVLFANMEDSCRRCIRKAIKCGLTIEEATDINFADDYYSQLKDVFAKQSLVPTYEIERVRELIKHIYPTGMLLLLRARNPDGVCIATGMFPAMNHTMYFWGGASWRECQTLRPNESIQWYAIKYWKNRGVRFYDMMGKAEYKRKYGGYSICIPWFRKSKYSLVSKSRNTANKLMKIRQRILGRL